MCWSCPGSSRAAICQIGSRPVPRASSPLLEDRGISNLTQAMELNNSTVSPLRQRMIEDMVARKWVFRFMRAGERSEMGLGSVPAVNLAQAREKAADAHRPVKAAGRAKCER